MDFNNSMIFNPNSTEEKSSNSIKRKKGKKSIETNTKINSKQEITCQKETKKTYNIEDLLLLEEKFYDVYMAINSNTNVANECFEFINFYNQSSLFNKFENYFKDFQTKSIVHFSLILMIFDLMLIYHISFDIIFFNYIFNFFIQSPISNPLYFSFIYYIIIIIISF